MFLENKKNLFLPNIYGTIRIFRFVGKTENVPLRDDDDGLSTELVCAPNLLDLRAHTTPGLTSRKHQVLRIVYSRHEVLVGWWDGWFVCLFGVCFCWLVNWLVG